MTRTYTLPDDTVALPILEFFKNNVSIAAAVTVNRLSVLLDLVKWSFGLEYYFGRKSFGQMISNVVF
jgi:hypothetical protein